MTGFFVAVAVVIVWGITFANTRALLADFSALEIQFLRFAMAYAALCSLGGFERTKRHDELVFAGMGFLGVFMYQLLENCAIYYTNASNVAILVSFCPIVTALFAYWFIGDRTLSARMVAGSLLAMAGVSLVSWNGVVGFRFRPIGDLMALAAMLCWGGYSVLVDRSNRSGLSPLTVIRRTFFWALVMMIPLCLWGTTGAGRLVLDGSFAVTLDAAENLRRFAKPMNWVNLAFLGLLASAACFVLWSVACRLLGMVRTTIGIYFIPVVGVVFASLTLDERVSAMSVAGGGLIIIGVAIAGHVKEAR